MSSLSIIRDLVTKYFRLAKGVNERELVVSQREGRKKRLKIPRLPQNQLAVEILDNLARFPHCILLTRVGNFYESYFDQAAEVARLLSIKLAKRIWDRQEVLMCGFPIMHLDRHLKVLIQTHRRYVALCEEFKRTPPEEGFERRVVRVLTPGTLIDESFLNPYENNYLLAISSSHSEPSSEDAYDIKYSTSSSLGMAWIDISTGEFFTQQSTLATIKDDLARISPREVVLSSAFRDAREHPIRLAVTEEDRLISYIVPKTAGVPLDSTLDLALEVADDVSPKATSQSTNETLSLNETLAISLLITFLQANLLECMPSLSSPTSQGHRDRMHIDSQTIKALEIKEEMREGGVTGSLLSVIRRTVTTSGTRLLGRWLCSPSTSIVEIEARQNLVSFFLRRPHLRFDLVQLLKRLEDALRIVQRFLSGKGDVSDLSAIKNTIDIWGVIKHRIEQEYEMERKDGSHTVANEWLDVQHLLTRMVDLHGLASRIGMAVDSQANEQSITEIEGEDEFHTFPDVKETTRANTGIVNWAGQFKSVIKPNFSDVLASLHTRLADNQAARQRLEQELQHRYDAPSLTLRSSPRAGIHVHIARSNRDAGKVEGSSQFIPISSTSSTKTYFNQAWHILGTSIIELIMQIFAAEKVAFETLRQEVNLEALALRRNARIADELDITIGFASLADEMKLVRPTLNESTSFSVINGRHPSVELGLLSAGRVFTPNTVCLTPHSRLHIITGPNMAGKSTLLRQTALLAILAQIGSFVPADKAEIGIVDRVFARIGANDDLFRDRSTFMVEMLETSNILQRATEKSLVIMDEVGRGTTVTDGLAIAFATIFHMYTHNRCRALFATHFHEVADMVGYEESLVSSGYFKDIGFFCTNVDETADGHFAYSHRLRPGVNRDSHGLKVARLAGLPPPAMQMAQDALTWMGTEKGSWMADTAQLRLAGQSLLLKCQDNKSS
ncbi:muts domain V-domain-containing protein [Hysterangium stoloniferum]|nr:muts domain V-domain-containing protein [Hysterangium stoloniferum]